MQTTFPRAGRRPLVIGHRGARAVLPENTLPAFRHAIEHGADCLELDVAVSKDDIVVVTHDLIAKRRLSLAPRQQRLIRHLTFEQLREWDCGMVRRVGFRRQQPVPGERMPALEEVLELGRQNRIGFFIELKSDRLRPTLTPPPDEYAERVLAVLRKCRMERRTLLMSFDPRLLRALEKAASAIPRGRLYSMRMRAVAQIAAQGHCSAICPNVSLVTERKVTRAHELGLRVIAWTANRPAAWKRLIETGVDGIITDDPARLREYLTKLRL